MVDIKFRVLTILAYQKEWVNSNFLVKSLDMSRRSLITHINEINQDYPGTIVSGSKGYRLLRPEIIEHYESSQDIPITREERKSYIIHHTLLNNESLLIDDLVNFFYISKITLQNELTKLRKELEDNQLSLKTKSGRIYITGDDINKKTYATKLVAKELENVYFDLQKIQNCFPDMDLTEIRSIITESLNRHEYFLDDYSLLNYIMHIAVSISIKRSHTTQEPSKEPNSSYVLNVVSPHILKIVYEIFEQIDLLYHVKFSYSEILDASMLMVTRVIAKDTNKMNLSQIDQIVGNEISDLMSDIVDRVSATYQINLNQENFLVRFALHLKNLFIRYSNHVDIENIQFNYIKNNFPFTYTIAVYIAQIIAEKIRIGLSENEIAYIALHVGVLIQEQKLATNKLSCVIFSTEYNFINKAGFIRFREKYDKELQILDIISTFDQLDKIDNINLIISFNDLGNRKFNYVFISPFFTNEDEIKINQAIEREQKYKTHQLLLEKIHELFHEHLFFFNTDFKDSHEVIEYVCDYLLDFGLIDENYKEEIYEHENIAPTSYGNFAIPHPLTHKSTSSFIAVVVQKEAIQWGDNQINLVFMLSFKEEDRYLVKYIFESISEIVFNNDKLVTCQSYQEFMDVFLAYLS